MLDLLRCLAAISPGLGALPSPPRLFAVCDWDASTPSDKTRDTNSILVLRALANLFCTKQGRGTMEKQAGEVLARLKAREWAKVGKGKLPASTIALK